MAAIDKGDPSKDYVWDGADEDDRPFSQEELTAGLEAYRNAISLSGERKEGGG